MYADSPSSYVMLRSRTLGQVLVLNDPPERSHRIRKIVAGLAPPLGPPSCAYHEEMTSMLGDPTFSDVAFVVTHVDHHGEETTSAPIAAHKALLAARRRGRFHTCIYIQLQCLELKRLRASVGPRIA